MTQKADHRSLAPRSIHNMTVAQKKERLNRWIQWRRAGYSGSNLEKRTKLSLTNAKRLAEELNISLEGVL